MYFAPCLRVSVASQFWQTLKRYVFDSQQLWKGEEILLIAHVQEKIELDDREQ